MTSTKKHKVRTIRGSVALAMNSVAVEHPMDMEPVANGKAEFDSKSGDNYFDHELRCDWCNLQMSACDGGSCIRCEHVFHVDCFWRHLAVNAHCFGQLEDNSAHESSMDMDTNLQRTSCEDASNVNTESDLPDSSIVCDPTRNIFVSAGDNVICEHANDIEYLCKLCSM